MIPVVVWLGEALTIREDRNARYTRGVTPARSFVTCAVLTAVVVMNTAVAPSALQRQVLVPASDINALKREYTFIRFSQLTTSMTPPAPPRHDLGTAPKPKSGPQSLIPADARAWNGRKVSIRGYVVPVDVDRSGIREFVLSASVDSCHFGVLGGPDEWIYVTMAEGMRIPTTGVSPVTVFGVLDVGEDVQGGIVNSLYRMRGERIAVH